MTPSSSSAAAEVDGRRHGLEVEGRLKPREVGKVAASGEDEEIVTLLHDAFVEALRGLFKLREESLEEEHVPGLVVVPLHGEGRDLDPQAIPNSTRTGHQVI